MKYYVSPRKFESYKKWKQRQNEKLVNDFYNEIKRQREITYKALTENKSLKVANTIYFWTFIIINVLSVINIVMQLSK